MDDLNPEELVRSLKTGYAYKVLLPDGTYVREGDTTQLEGENWALVPRTEVRPDMQYSNAYEAGRKARAFGGKIQRVTRVKESLVRKVIGESARPVLPVIEATKPVKIYVCPHCNEEILEKHTYVLEGIDHHSDCGKPIKWPEPDWSKVVAWLRPPGK